ncbi:ABC transporter ATP-binding protein [Vagococcus sp. BWB3-3]|uniref:ABC-type quaternary amine transporter n=1 Tax=Vagococcus allomyrinae TaxID=2794353 RepID=A0A940P9N7_9ENTE|nr:ABC transporter ATP-binding protein [Vagococcus allomyrinae]MBP1042196.1 ABC transporter ATP-binding protein [Vagococcus allomyrinae]
MGLELQHVSFSHQNKQILESINLCIEPGEVVSLLGPSGVGKTTLLKIIAGLERADTGQIIFQNDYSQEATVLVFQDFWLFPHMTVSENISFGLRMKKGDKAAIAKKVALICQKLQLEGLERAYPAELSGGQQQRVALARAVILEPRLLLLDEPFSSLDANLRGSTREYLVALQKEYHFSILLVTHDKEEAFQLSDKVAVMLGGRIVQVAKPKDLYFNPNSKEVADFLNEMNYLKGTVHSTNFLIAGTETVITVANPADLNGEAVLLVPFGQPFVFGSEGLKGTVEKITWQPSGQRYSLRIGETLCYFTNIGGQALVGDGVYLDTQETSWQVMLP